MEEMVMNKKIISSVIALSLGSIASFNACAALNSNAILEFTSGATCYDSCGPTTPSTSGSYFAMDTNGNGILSEDEKTAITRQQGIRINAIQFASYSNTTTPSGSIDTFSFFGNTGVHQTISPVTVLSDDGSGLVTLDFSGWGMVWYNDSYVMDLGGHNPAFPTTGIATLTCGIDCSLGDTFILDYQTRVTSTVFDGLLYGAHFEGVISTVPVPAAVWLFGSGLIGLAGIAQRHKAG